MSIVETPQVQRKTMSWMAATVVFTNIGLACLVAWALYSFGSVGDALGYVKGQRLFASVDAVVSTVEGQPRQFDVAGDNMGDRPVRILGGQSSCSCLVPLGLPTALPAHGRLTIPVSLRPKGRIGRFSQALRLFTDDPNQRDLAVVVRCHVAEAGARPKKGAPRSDGGGEHVGPEA